MITLIETLSALAAICADDYAGESTRQVASAAYFAAFAAAADQGGEIGAAVAALHAGLPEPRQ